MARIWPKIFKSSNSGCNFQQLLGETVLEDAILIAPLEVNLYELYRELLVKLKEEHQI